MEKLRCGAFSQSGFKHYADYYFYITRRETIAYYILVLLSPQRRPSCLHCVNCSITLRKENHDRLFPDSNTLSVVDRYFDRVVWGQLAPAFTDANKIPVVVILYSTSSDTSTVLLNRKLKNRRNSRECQLAFGILLKPTAFEILPTSARHSSRHGHELIKANLTKQTLSCPFFH